MSSRVFKAEPAVRHEVPLLIGLSGPSGGGKTFSALRLATGIQRICGGDIAVIDTESRRALHYADKFKFKHIPFVAPFGSLDYLEAMRYAVGIGSKCIVIDSMSHEHEGPGGLLDYHQEEVKRLSKGDEDRENAVKMLAWVKPQGERRQLINSMLQLSANFIFCFRAKEKLKLEKGKDPLNQGYMPIAGEEFVFEMTVSALLLPGANGVPSWNPLEVGERKMIKRPGQFHEILKPNQVLDESAGEFMAKWARGEVQEPLSSEEQEQVLACEISIGECEDAAKLEAIGERIKAMRKPAQDQLRGQFLKKKKELGKAVTA